MSKIDKRDYEKHLDAVKDDGRGYFKEVIKAFLKEQENAHVGLYSPPFVYAPIAVFKNFPHFLRLEGEFEPRTDDRAVIALNKLSLFCPQSLPDSLLRFVNHHNYLNPPRKEETIINYPVFAYCQDELWLVAVVDSLDGHDDVYKLHLLREYIIKHVLSSTGILMGDRIVKIESERVKVKTYRLVITHLDKWSEENLRGCEFSTFGKIKPYEKNLELVRDFFSRVRKIDEIFNDGEFHRTESEIREGLWFFGKGYAERGAKEMANLKKSFKTIPFS